jgi:hypothetical protein
MSTSSAWQVTAAAAVLAAAWAVADAAAAPAPKKANPSRRKRPPRPTYLDAATAGADFKVQGEYQGAVGAAKKKIGIQVRALGRGRFRAVFLAGGLPGAGWDGKTRIEVNGQTQGSRTVFAPPAGRKGYSAAILGGKLTGRTDRGQPIAAKKTLRKSPTLGAKPPTGAIVLFAGTGVDAWQGGRMDKRKLLAAGTRTRRNFQSFTLHVEFCVPFQPYGGGGRGNSGVYLQERYEIQITDAFGNRGGAGECGAVYRTKPPKVNMSLPPLSWQTLDVDFRAAKFGADGRKTANTVVTVRHNGVVVHDKYAVPNKTGNGKPEGPEPRPIHLQAHGNPVFFRNVWVVEKD